MTLRPLQRLLIAALPLLVACPKKTPETPVDGTATAPADGTTTAATDAPKPDEPKKDEPKNDAPKGDEPAAPTSPALAGGALTAEERAINDAVALLEAGDAASRAKAQGQLQDLAKKHPEMAHVWFNLGVASYQAGDLAKARDHFETAAEKDPKFGYPFLYLGVIDEQEKGRDAAISTWRTGVEHDPENIELRVAIIGALRDGGRTDEAIREAKAALLVNSNSLAVYNTLGLIYLEKGDLDLAKFVYLKARDVPGGDQDVYIRTNLARILYLQGEKSAALFNYQEAVKIDPNFLPALVYLAEMYQAEHNYGDMLPLLETAAKQAPENHGVQMNLGIAYRGLGRYPEAKAAWEKALKIAPSDPSPHFNLGILYGDYLKTPEGVKMYDEAITSFNTYLTAGGPQKELAKEYLDAVEKDKKKFLKKKEKEASDAKKKADAAAAEAAEREAARKAEEEAKKNPPPPEPAPEGAPQ